MSLVNGNGDERLIRDSALTLAIRDPLKRCVCSSCSSQFSYTNLHSYRRRARIGGTGYTTDDDETDVERSRPETEDSYGIPAETEGLLS